MKKIIALFLFGLYFSPILPSAEADSSQENIEFQCTLSNEDLVLLEKHSSDFFVHIPNAVKTAVAQLCQHVPELDACTDISLFLNDAIHLAPYSILQSQAHFICSLVSHSDIAPQIPSSLARTIEQYMNDLESNALTIDTTSFEEQKDSGTRGADTLTLFNTNNGLAILSAGMINILGGTNISTSGLGSTVTISTSGSVTDSFPTDSGVAIPAAGALTVHGGTNITTSGSGSTVTISSSGAVSDSFPTDSGTAIPSAGALTIHGGNNITTSGSGSTVTVNVAGTTNNAVQVGNGTNSLNSLTVGTNGQVLIGSTANPPAFATLTSTGGTITFTPGAHSLDLETSGSTANSFPTDSGTAVPSAGALTIHGGNNISTSGSGSTVTVNVAGTTNHAVQIGNGTNSLTSLAVGTNGQVLIGASSASPAFATLTSGNSSITFTPGANSLALQSNTVFGNTLIVDPINGSASATATNGLSFTTISLALTAAATIATSSRPVTIWVLPGYYNETLTMQSYVSVIGISQGAGAETTPYAGVCIQKLGVTANTTLVTMTDNSRLENVSLNLTESGTNAVSLTGISFPSPTSSATARVASVMLTVTNAGTTSGSETTYGVSSTSTGVPLLEVPALRDTTIYVNSSATTSGQVAGIIINAGTNSEGLTIQDCNINVSVSGSLTTTTPVALLLQTGICYITDSTLTITSSAVGAIGVSTATSGDSCVINNCYISATCTTTGTLLAYGIDVVAGATCNANNSSTSGTNTVTASNGSDVTNAGTLTVSNTVLVHGTTNNTMFTSIPSSLLCWTTTGTFTSTSNLQLMVGGGAASGAGTYSNAYYTASRPLTLKNLHVQTNGNISGGSRTFTVYTGPNGSAAASSVTCTIASGAASSSDTTHSVAVSTGQVFYMLMTGAATSVANPVVTLEMY